MFPLGQFYHKWSQMFVEIQELMKSSLVSVPFSLITKIIVAVNIPDIRVCVII